MVIQKIQIMVGYQLVIIMEFTIKVHHLTGGLLRLATSAPMSWAWTAATAISGGNGVGNNSFAVRPIVCIPTSVFNNKYTLENK